MPPSPTPSLFSRFNVSPKKVIKIGLIGLTGLVVFIFVINLVGSSLRPVLPGFGLGSSKSIGSIDADDFSYADNALYEESAPSLSMRNVASFPGGNYSSGDDAEAFEVTDYTAEVETRNLAETCDTVGALKAHSYVIFEQSTVSIAGRGCGFAFKVERARTEEVLEAIRALNPEVLIEHTLTIKQQVADFTSEMELLENKQASIETTLREALNSYEEIADIAVAARDAESLASIIDSKVQLIERLSYAQIEVADQLDNLARAKAQQLDRLEYTYFSVSVYENRFVDGTSLKASWKSAVQSFVRSVNDSLQNATLGVVEFIVVLLPLLLYFAIFLIVAKYVWRFTKSIWQK